MSENSKRAYRSTTRDSKAQATKERILSEAKTLFATFGFEAVTIEKIAESAGVSIPTVYALFQSKRGVLRAALDEALPKEQFHQLVEQSVREKCPKKRLAFSAKIAREMYDAENAQMDIFRGASVLSPEFKELEKIREMRRYERQEVTIKAMIKEKSLAEGLDQTKARDILWAFTGRDLYRMFVIEKGWTSDEYELWLTKSLINFLLNKELK